MALAGLDHSGGVTPLLLLLIFDPEDMAHDDQVAIDICMLEGRSENIAESIKCRASLTFRILHIYCRVRVKELKEVHCFYDASACIFDCERVTAMMSEVSSSKHSNYEEAIVLCHAFCKLVANFPNLACKWLSFRFREAPKAEISQGANSFIDYII